MQQRSKSSNKKLKNQTWKGKCGDIQVSTIKEYMIQGSLESDKISEYKGESKLSPTSISPEGSRTMDKEMPQNGSRKRGRRLRLCC